MARCSRSEVEACPSILSAESRTSSSFAHIQGASFRRSDRPIACRCPAYSNMLHTRRRLVVFDDQKDRRCQTRLSVLARDLPSAA